MNDIYKDAFAEVYAILEWLDETEYEKIPKDVIQAIEENRNQDYFYELNRDVDLIEQPMLPETKAILFNLFRDYLSTPEQSANIKRRQKEERIKNEIEKSNKYNKENIFENTVNQDIKDNEKQDNGIIDVSKQNFLQRIFIKIKRFFFNKK